MMERRWKCFIHVLLLFIFTINGVNGKRKHRHHRYALQSPAFYQPRTTLGSANQITNPDARSLPDAITKLLGTETKDGTEYELMGCKLKASKDDCKFEFLPTSAECKDKLTLSKTFENLLGVKLEETVEKLIPALVFSMEKLKIDKCKGDIEFTAKAREPFDLVKDKLKVKDGQISVSLNYKELTLEKFGIEVNGKLEIQGKDVPIVFTKKKDSLEGQIIINTDEIKVQDFKSLLSKAEIEEKSEDGDKTKPKVGLFTDAVIKKPQIIGSRSSDSFFEVVLSGQVTGIKGVGDATIFLVVQKPVSEPTAVGIIGSIKKISPSVILTTLFGVDFTEVPLLKDIEIDLVMEAANKDMLTLKNADLNKMLAKYTDNGKVISGGFRLKCTIPIREIISKSSKANTKNIPESITLQLIARDGKIEFKFPPDAKMDLLNIAIALTPTLAGKSFDKFLKTSPKVNISKFDIDVKTMTVDVQMKTIEEVSIADGFLTLKKASFVLQHKKGGSWDFKVESTQQIGDGVLSVKIEKSGDTFKLFGEISDISTRQIAAHFAKENKLAEKMLEHDFLNFGIKDLKVKTEFDGQKLNVDISGNPVLFDWEGAKFQGVIMETTDGDDKKRDFALAVVLKDINVDAIIEKILKKKPGKLGWMAKATTSFFMSTIEKKDLIDFKTLGMSFPMKQGIFFRTEFTAPQKCDEDKFCELIKEKITPDTKLIAEGEITINGIKLSASYTGGIIQFGDIAKLVEIKLMFIADFNNAELFLSGTMKLNDPPLALKASIGIGVTGSLSLTLTMNGIWEKPFGVPFIAFGNIMIGAAVNPVLPLPAFDLTGELHIGQIGTPDVIKGKLAAGFDIKDLFNSYFYAEISEFTLGKVLKAYGAQVTLPAVVEDTGFPKGILVSFSGNPKGKRIDHMDLQIPSGFQFSGTIRFLKIEAKCSIKVTYPLNVKVEVDLKPLSLVKGALVLSRSMNDRENGPKVFVGVSTTGVAVKVAAYVEMMGIGAEATIDISNKGFKFNVYGQLFGLIGANVTVQAPYGKGDIKGTNFMASACLSTSVPEISMQSKEVVIEGAEETKKTYDESTEHLKESGELSNSTAEKYSFWQNKINKNQAIIIRKMKKLEKIEGILNDKCSDQCQDECIGGPVMEKSKSKLLNKLSISKPKWDPCKTKGESLTCIAKCKAKQVYLAGKAEKKKITMQMHMKSIQMMEKIVELNKQLTEKAGALMVMVNEAAAKVETACAAGKKAMDAIAKYTKENIIDVRNVCFNATIQDATNTCLGFNVDVVIGGQKDKPLLFDVKACLDTSFVKTIAKAIAGQVYPGIDKVKEGLNKAKEFFQNVRKKKDEVKKSVADIESEQVKLEKEIPEANDDEEEDNDEEEEKATQSRKSAVDTRTIPRSMMKEYINYYAYADFPALSFQDDDALDAFTVRSPWAFAQHDDPFTVIEADDLTNATDSFGRELEGDESKPLGNEGDCVPAYSIISKGLTDVANSFLDELQLFTNNLKTMSRENEETEKEVKSLGLKGDFNEYQRDNINRFIKQLQNGTQKWSQTVEQQIKTQEQSLIKNFKTDLNEFTTKEYGQTFDEFLTSHSQSVVKRSQIMNNVTSTASASSLKDLVKYLLTEDNGTLTSKLSYVTKLNGEMKKTGLTCV